MCLRRSGREPNEERPAVRTRRGFRSRFAIGRRSRRGRQTGGAMHQNNSVWLRSGTRVPQSQGPKKLVDRWIFLARVTSPLSAGGFQFYGPGKNRQNQAKSAKNRQKIGKKQAEQLEIVFPYIHNSLECKGISMPRFPTVFSRAMATAGAKPSSGLEIRKNHHFAAQSRRKIIVLRVTSFWTPFVSLVLQQLANSALGSTWAAGP